VLLCTNSELSEKDVKKAIPLVITTKNKTPMNTFNQKDE
jgi:hypothetical protein